VERHQDSVKDAHCFDALFNRLSTNGPMDLETRAGTRFEVSGGSAQKGDREGEDVIRFFQKGKEFARAYTCCLGRYYNCK
jgi:hypothetical protein